MTTWAPSRNAATIGCVDPITLAIGRAKAFLDYSITRMY